MNGIAKRRRELGLTQVDVATRAKMSLSSLRAAEAGSFTTKTLRKLAIILGCDAHELRHGGESSAGATPITQPPLTALEVLLRARAEIDLAIELIQGRVEQ